MSSRTSVYASLSYDEGYGDLEASIANAISDGTLFQTDANPDAMWAAYLGSLPEGRRQFYACHACRHFIQRFGGLVTIDVTGRQQSALWSAMPPQFFLRAVESLQSLANKAKVTGVFLSVDKTLGTPRTGEWTHIAAVNPKPFKDRVLTASQAMAERVEDYKMLCHGLADYSRESVEQAVRVLKADAVYRSEKALGIAEWFLKLHEAIRGNSKVKRNLTWLAVANAPTGFCHIRSTMISTLLDDINAGLPFDDIARRWKDKMHPLQYQRPTAPAKEGTIKRAEELVAKLGLERSLLRRYATLDDLLVKLWVPRELPSAAKTGGVFDHLRSQRKPEAIELPATKITWEKFNRTVLPHALKMEIMVPSRGAFCGVMTAVDPEAPPIIQWDGLAGHPRNPVSWYYWEMGSLASQWGLSTGWHDVSCIFPAPPHWQEPEKFKHQKHAIHFAIVGCVESSPASLSLFPEILKAELHGIRAVIEAHSNRGGCGQDAEKGTANGLTLDGREPLRLRVRTSEGLASCIVDRMD
jgi:hypothetical protein